MNTTVLSRALRAGIRSLALHKLRSFLTTLGVLFGTSSVIAMLAIGEGASYEAQEQIKQLGSNNVILRSIKPPEDPNSGSQTSRMVSYGLTRMDLERVAQTFPSIARLVAVREISEEVRVGKLTANPRILATQPNYLEVTGRLLWEGRFLSEQDALSKNRVCAIESELARYYFPLESPLGKRVKLGAYYFEVVGTVAPRVRSGDDPAKPDEVTGEIFIPLETSAEMFGKIQVKQRAGSRDMEQVELHEIVVRVDGDDAVPVVAGAAREMLNRFHGKKDYELIVPLELLARAEETKRIFNVVLGSIAGISLLVGGIGIMNVMLATVTERTREIGVRRALGAKKRHIVSQFLVETVLLSVGGGGLGVALGLLIPVLVEHFAEMRTIVTPVAPAFAFLISAGVGVVFGLYPAWRAADMDPVEALRHE